MSSDKPVVVSFGIDLGTTFSCIATARETNESHKKLVADVIDDNGHRTTPSWVGFKGDKMHVGIVAKNLASANKRNTIYDAKRIIGHKIDEEAVQRDISTWPFKVVDDGNKNPLFEVQYQGKVQRFTPQQISSFVLKSMVDMALPKVLGGEDYDKNITKNVVVTIPAYFNDGQRRATIEAVQLAGLNPLRIINEPTAAAIAYGYSNRKENRTILVYDFGGGTFDVSIIKVANGSDITVMATDGNDHLGGEDITNRLVSYFCNENEIDIESNPQYIPRIKNACDDCKITLSTSNECEINVDIEDDTMNLTISKAKLNDLCKDIFKKTIEIVERTIQSKNISKKDIDDIVLVGGSSRIPIIEDLLRECFPGKNINKDINPDEAVSIGAALLASDLVRGTYEHSFSNGSKAIVDINNDEVLATVNNIPPPVDEVIIENNNNNNNRGDGGGDRKEDDDCGAVIIKKGKVDPKPPTATINNNKSTMKESQHNNHHEPPPSSFPPPLPIPPSPVTTSAVVNEEEEEEENLPVETLGFKKPIKPSSSATLVVKDVLSHSIGINVHGDKLNVILEKNSHIPCSNNISGYAPSRDGQSKMIMKILEGDDPVASHNRVIRSYTIDGLPTDKKKEEFNFTYTMSINENGILTFSYKEAHNYVPEGSFTVGNI